MLKNKKLSYTVAICLAMISINAIGSANSYIREKERLVAHSSSTFTVLVSQYEQTFSYWTGINRQFLRVVDISTNEVLSEILLSSFQSDRSMDEPYEVTRTPLPDEDSAFKGVLTEPQVIYNNLQYPLYRFHLDTKGVYINRNVRKDLIGLPVLQSRFSSLTEIQMQLSQKFDVSSLLKSALNTNEYEFTGWYKTSLDGRSYYYLVLRIGSFEDDTNGLEYVFSIPDRDK